MLLRMDVIMGMTEPVFCSPFTWKGKLKTKLVWLRTSESSCVNFVLSNLKHRSLSLRDAQGRWPSFLSEW